MRFIFSFFLAIAFCAGGAQSQVLEEIVVTAQKVEESAQDVGIAITAFSGDQLKELGFSGSLELEMHTPGLMTSDFSGGAGSVYTLRGVGQLDFGDHQEQTVAVYTDGAYNSFLGGGGFRHVRCRARGDTEGSPGHPVRAQCHRWGWCTSSPPSRRANRTGTSKSEPASTANTGANWRSGGRWASRYRHGFAGVVHQSDSMIKNSLGPGWLDYDNYNGRLQLLWDASEDVEVLVSGYYGRYKNNGGRYTRHPGDH